MTVAGMNCWILDKYYSINVVLKGQDWIDELQVEIEVSVSNAKQHFPLSILNQQLILIHSNQQYID